jgi:polo-like kinase 1
LDDESVIIEEHRRKLNGEGYTLHRYLRGKMLGKGGFAKVYLCTALDTQKAYAIKIVPKANLVKARALQKVRHKMFKPVVRIKRSNSHTNCICFISNLQLKAEIKIHRTLKHSNVCEYKHFFEDKTNCYILLELCHNQSMNEMIKRRKRLTEPETAFFMTQILEATKYIHEQLVIHRDLKLGNLFLDRNMNIKVGDLGLATKLESADEIRKTICGTPNYIAPEVIQGDRATRGHSFEVDIWSMGVIMFTCLCGKPPYEAKDVKATYQRIMANAYSFPKNVAISDDAKSLIISMLQSKARDRPTLHQISTHPFLNANAHFIPESLPSSATHTAPQWGTKSQQQMAFDRPALPKPISQRKAFGARDTNAQNIVPERVEKKRAPASTGNLLPMMDVQGAVRSAWTAVVNVASPTRATKQLGKFQVFDETNNRNSQREEISDRDIVSRTANLGIQSTDDNLNLDVTASPNTDSFILSNMLERVSIVLDIVSSIDYSNVSPGSQSLIPVSFGGPSKWVERYVDYTSKYGLGYLLSDGRYVCTRVSREVYLVL